MRLRAAAMATWTLLLGTAAGLAVPAVGQPAARRSKAGALPPPAAPLPRRQLVERRRQRRRRSTRAARPSSQFIGPTRRLHPDFGHESGDIAAQRHHLGHAVHRRVRRRAARTRDLRVRRRERRGRARPAARLPDSRRGEDASRAGSRAACPGGGDSGDRHLLIVDRDHRLLLELYALRWNATRAPVGGGLRGGVPPRRQRQRRPDGWTSADAAGLAILPGLDPIRRGLRHRAHQARVPRHGPRHQRLRVTRPRTGPAPTRRPCRWARGCG